MKWLLLLLLLSGCTATLSPSAFIKKARVTYYCAHEDRRWGNKTACGKRAKMGTAAVAAYIPFGTAFRIPALACIFGSDRFVVEDRGSAVESRKASKGLLPIIDVYTPSKKMMNRLAAIMPPVLEIE